MDEERLEQIEALKGEKEEILDALQTIADLDRPPGPYMTAREVAELAVDIARSVLREHRPEELMP